MTEPNRATLYQKIEHWLRARVLEGQEGDALPSETDLASQFGVSRMTARQAIQNLAAEGLVRRMRGSGTFIAPKPLHRHSGPLMSYTLDMRRRGMSASSELIGAQLRLSTEAEALALRLEPGGRVVAIDRVRLADGTPMAIDHACLTPDCATVLAKDLEGGSLHENLRQLGREPTVALSWISARTATAAEAKLLHLPPRSAVLVERRIISDQNGQPMEYTTSIFNAGRYVIDAVFTLAHAASTPLGGPDSVGAGAAFGGSGGTHAATERRRRRKAEKAPAG
jgi:GntR family transcriptional regulator